MNKMDEIESQSHTKFKVADERNIINNLFKNIIYRCRICFRAVCCIPLDRIISTRFHNNLNLSKESISKQNGPSNKFREDYLRDSIRQINSPQEFLDKNVKFNTATLQSKSIKDKNNNLYKFLYEKKRKNNKKINLPCEKKLLNGIATKLPSEKRLSNVTTSTGKKIKNKNSSKKLKRKISINRLFKRKGIKKSATVVNIVTSALKWVRDSEMNIISNEPPLEFSNNYSKKVKIRPRNMNSRQSLTVMTFCTKHDKNDSAGDCPDSSADRNKSINQNGSVHVISINLNNTESIQYEENY